jgi:hypothetical protein
MITHKEFSVMTDPKKFFQDNVAKHAISPTRPIEYNEQRGFLAIAEMLERLEFRLLQIEQEQSALRQLLLTLSNQIALLN